MSDIGEVRDYITNTAGKKTKVDIAVVTDKFSRGIGFVKKQNDEYVVRADTWNKSSEVATLLNQIQHKYMVKAVKRALKQQRYHISMEEHDENNKAVVLTARRY